jgi:hypothetical protein
MVSVVLHVLGILLSAGGFICGLVLSVLFLI